MTRSKRLEPVQRAVDTLEERAALALAASERRVQECRAKLEELVRYRGEYEKQLAARQREGIGALGLRDFHAFIGRLGEAIKQQQAVVERAGVERDRERARWAQTARRAKAVEHVGELWRAEERRDLDRREQRETDERAQRQRDDKQSRE